jgi:uncharacterized protein (TIGR03437 family)
VRPTLHRLRQFISLFGLILFCVCLGLPGYLNAQSQVSWNYLGPFGAPVRVVMIATDPRTDSVMYVVTPGAGVWKTTDGAQSWTASSDSISTLQVCSIAIDPHSPDVLYVGTGDDQSPRPLQGVEISSDGGRTWTIQARFTNQPVCAVAVDPVNSAHVFAGSAEGLFISSDAGATWTKAVNSPVSSIAFDSQGVAYAGTVGADSGGSRDHVLIRSSNGGATWTNISLPANPFASTSQTTGVNVKIGASTISVLVSYEATPFLPGSSSAANSALSVVDYYQSPDGGNTWSTPTRVGMARPPTQLLTDASGILYVTGSTLFTSTNQGTSWIPISTATSDFHTAVFTGGMLLLGGEKGLESVSLAQGTTPLAVPKLPAGQFLGVNLDSKNNVWTAGPGGLFGPVSSIGPSIIQKINAVGSVAAAANSTDIFTAGNKQVAGSTDGGQNFSIHDVLASDELRAPFPPLLVDPVNNSSVFVAGTHVYHSTNSGQSWTVLPVVDPDATHVVIALTLAPASRTTMYAATACLPEVVLTSCPATSIIWRSANSGQTWTQEGSVYGYVNRLAVDPRQTNTIYAAIGAFPGGPSLSAGYVRGDLLQSTTMGSTWVSIRTNLPNVSVNAVVIDPTSLPPLTVTIIPPIGGGPFGFPIGPIRTIVNMPAQTLYVATDAGVFVTFNLGGGGNNPPTPQWTDISSGLPPAPVTDISLRQPGGILSAATFGRGVYSISTTGLSGEIVVSSLSIETSVMQGVTGTVAVPLINISTTNSFGWRLNARDPWLSIVQANGTLAPRASGQVPVHISAAALQTGTYLGRLQFISGAFVQNVFITLHVTAAPAQITIISGDNASGKVGAILPALQVLVVDANRNPLAGIPVSFTVTTGGGSVSTPIAFTDNLGVASTVVTLPPSPGVVQLIAASGGLSVTFSLTAVNAPSLLANAVLDGVTFNPYMSPAPGSIISIGGQNLSQTTLASGAGALPQILGTTRALLVTTANTLALPLLYVSPGQINAMLPTDVSPGFYSLRIENASVPSNDIPLSVAPFDPGILTQNSTGHGLGIFLKSDGSTVSVSNPADRGSTITLFAAGLGAVDPPVAAGQPGALAEPFNRTVVVPRVVFDIYPADLIYSGLPAGAPEPYQITVRVPSQLSPATNVSVSLAIGGFESNRVTIPVR